MQLFFYEVHILDFCMNLLSYKGFSINKNQKSIVVLKYLFNVTFLHEIVENTVTITIEIACNSNSIMHTYLIFAWSKCLNTKNVH